MLTPIVTYLGPAHCQRPVSPRGQLAAPCAAPKEAPKR